LLSKTVTAGSAPTLSVWVNGPTNQLGEYEYDANGNQLTGLSSQYFTYDSENRMIGAYTNGSDYVQYAYDSQNKRVFSSPYASGSQGPQHVYFYGVDGQQLGAYPLSSGASALEIATYFGSKRLGFNTNPSNGSETATAPDRLGSYGSYYPWGESKSGNNPADIWSYATYWRDSFTGLDYANQRYYSNVQGRFMTPDPYRLSGSAADPGSWNRYAYAVGDPVNSNDPTGLDDTSPGTDAPDCGLFCTVDPNIIINIDPLEFAGVPAGLCDPSQNNCAPQCVSADGMMPLPGPGCPIADVPQPVATMQSGGQSAILGFLDSSCGCSVQPLGQVDWGAVWGDIQSGWSVLQIVLAIPALAVEQVIYSRGRGREGNVADTGVEAQMWALIQADKAKGITLTPCQALAQLLAQASDPQQRSKIIRTQKAWNCKNVQKQR
jgi:RHS repeat-associated protein